MAKKYHRGRRNKKEERKKVLNTIVLIFALGVFVFSGYKLYQIYADYKAGDDTYKSIEELAIQQPESEGEHGYEDYYVDFEALKGVNSEVIGWLRFDNPEIINYPIVQTTDNATYLGKAFDGTSSIFGTLFADMYNRSDFQDENTLIYGHNMKNGSMFGDLSDYNEETFFQENPYFYLYTPDGMASKYAICAVSVVKEDSDHYTISFESQDAYAQYLSMIKSTSFYDTGVSLDTGAKLMTLSTCTKADDERLIIQGVKIEEKEMVKSQED